MAGYGGRHGRNSVNLTIDQTLPWLDMPVP